MKTVDLGKEKHSLDELLTLARSEAVLIHSPLGEDFLLEQADQFDREVTLLGSSEKFTSFLEKRAEETDDIPLSEIRKRRGLERS
jgi:hypothetical protein